MPSALIHPYLFHPNSTHPTPFFSFHFNSSGKPTDLPVKLNPEAEISIRREHAAAAATTNGDQAGSGDGAARPYYDDEKAADGGNDDIYGITPASRNNNRSSLPTTTGGAGAMAGSQRSSALGGLTAGAKSLTSPRTSVTAGPTSIASAFGAAASSTSVSASSSAGTVASSSSSSSTTSAAAADFINCPGCGLRQAVSQGVCNNCEASLGGKGSRGSETAAGVKVDITEDTAEGHEEDEEDGNDALAGIGIGIFKGTVRDVEGASNYARQSQRKKRSSYDIAAALTASAQNEGARRRVRFDEDCIKETKRLLRECRGVHGSIDAEAVEAGYYYEDLPKSEATEKLRGAPDGSFLVLDGEEPKEGDCLVLCYVAKGAVRHLLIENVETSIRIKNSPSKFEFLSELVAFYAGPNDEMPNLLSLEGFGGDGLDEDGNADEDGRQGGRETAYVKTKMIPHSHLAEPWFHESMSRAEAVALIEFEPTGTFVVREDTDAPGQFQLSYVKNGRLMHKAIKQTKDGFVLDASEAAFSSLAEMMHFYASEQTENTDLVCRLRLPRTKTKDAAAGAANPKAAAANANAAAAAASANGNSSGRNSSSSNENGDGMRSRTGSNTAAPRNENSGAEKRPWLRTNMPKAHALEPIMDKPDGAFVIRSSETRPECFVLSYKFRGQIQHELIIVHSGANPGLFLDANPSKSFRSLPELVMYYEQPRSELKYPLLPSAIAPSPAPAVSPMKRTPSKRAAPAPPGLSRSSSRVSNGANAIAESPSGGGNNDEPRSPTSPRGSSSTDLGAPAPLSRGASSKQLPAPLSRAQSKQQLPVQLSRGQSSKSLAAQPAKLTRGQSNKSLLQGGGGTSGVGGSAGLRRVQSVRQGGVTVARSSGERLDQRAAMSNWYCMNLNAEQATSRIPTDREGAFVVRRSSEAGFATISYLHKGAIKHAAIEDTGQGLHVVDSEVYQPNLSALIAYYKIPTQTDLECSLVSW